ncbi:MATE efflux family protein 9-like [Dorcoceras hygrometricum]|uniref:MATE efflux family protein 9-like n=1 Tax=Dorcoceras hygrometricum TaxID=472368 RepID=A0A2Z7C410_9LAMI|nr:MATE efflux family protein 9-like [Dorcoceras hygrometricum]
MHVAAKGISHQGQLIIWQKSSQVSLYTTQSQAAGGNHLSVIFWPVIHHISVVFRYDNSVDHLSDDSIGPFGHDYSVSRSQRGFQSGHESIEWLNMQPDLSWLGKHGRDTLEAEIYTRYLTNQLNSNSTAKILRSSSITQLPNPTEHYSALKRSSKQQEMVTQKIKPAQEQAEQIYPEIFKHQQLCVSSPAAIQSLKWVEIERAKQGELSATKIVQTKAGNDGNLTEKFSNEQCRSRVSKEKRIRNIGLKIFEVLLNTCI